MTDDIGVINYISTTTRVSASSTVERTTYNMPYLLFDFVEVVMFISICTALIFFIYLAYKNKK